MPGEVAAQLSHLSPGNKIKPAKPWRPPPEAAALRISSISSVECSAAYLAEAHQRDDLEILTDLRALPFDANGNLPDEHMGTAAVAND